MTTRTMLVRQDALNARGSTRPLPVRPLLAGLAGLALAAVLVTVGLTRTATIGLEAASDPASALGASSGALTFSVAPGEGTPEETAYWIRHGHAPADDASARPE